MSQVASLQRVAIPVAGLLLSLLLAMTSCGGGAAPSPQPLVRTLSSVSVTPSKTSITVGSTQQFNAMGDYSDGTTQDLTSSASWSSSAPATATVQSSGQTNPGLATGVAAGSATITATAGGMSASTTLTVTSATLTSVFLSPSSSTISVGSTVQFTANANYSDGSTKTVTSSATWASSAPATATVETTGQASPGLADGVAAGTTTITATYNHISGTAALTVSNSSNTAMVPLMDMTNTSQTYLGFPGGLYENSSVTIPNDHASDGQAIANTIQPLDTNGNPSASGQVVLVSIGMSNAADEFGVFKQTAATDSRVNHTTLVIANGAKGGITACYWVVPFGPPPCSLNTGNQYDRVQTDVLAPLGVTEAQVQAVWIKEANGGPGVQGCGTGGGQPCNSLCDATTAGCSNTPTTTEALRYEAQLGEIVRAAKTRWPNLKLAFLTSRIYAGYATVNINPEPYAYEYGFSVKWFIQAQIDQIRSGAVDPVAGDLNYKNTPPTAPWLAWGPYIWASGDTPRSDGLIWCNNQTSAPCNGEEDFQNDGTHPDTLGMEKVAYGINTPGSVQNLLDFFLNSSYTKAWFAAP